MYDEEKLLDALREAVDALFPEGEPVIDVDGTKVYVEDHKMGTAIRVNPWNSEYSGVMGYGRAIPMQLNENGKTLIFTNPIYAAEYLTNLEEFLEKIAKNRKQAQVASTLRNGVEAVVSYLGDYVVVAARHIGDGYEVSVYGLDPEMASVIVGCATFVFAPLKAREINVRETTRGWVVTSTFGYAIDAARFYTEVAQ